MNTNEENKIVISEDLFMFVKSVRISYSIYDDEQSLREGIYSFSDSEVRDSSGDSQFIITRLSY